METFADIIKHLIPKGLSLAQLSRDSDIEYSYFHSLMRGHREYAVAGRAEKERRPLRSSPKKGMQTLDALARRGVRVTQHDRERMITACLDVPEGYRVVANPAEGDGPELKDYDLLSVSGWEDMTGEERRMFGELMQAWATRKDRDGDASGGDGNHQQEQSDDGEPQGAAKNG